MSSFPLSSHFQVENAQQLIALYKELLQMPIESKTQLQTFLTHSSDLESAISEDMAWRYIRMTCDTSNEEFNKAYTQFVTEIQPEIAPFDNQINEKIAAIPHINEWMLEPENEILLRSIQASIDIYREENIPLQAELATLAQEYGTIQGSLMVNLDGQEFTMQQASNFLLSTDRIKRETTWKAMQQLRMEQVPELEELMNKMVQIRHQVACNAGFKNYRDYMFKAMCRFDYSVQDCFDFHNSVEKHFVPIQKKLMQQRKEQMQLPSLMPWDTAVHPQGLAPLKPFENAQDLTQNTIAAFNELDPYFAQCIQTMESKNLLDLESRKGKAPGGYNYPLARTNMPFIFMNATGNLRDLETMVHEGGHAIHSFLMAPLALNAYKNTPSEVAELASMSMELLSMKGWHNFFADSNDLKRAQHEQLEGIAGTLCWIAQVDAFQHWMYQNPTHTAQERRKQWQQLNVRFGTGLVDYTDYPQAIDYSWHKQLHIFEVPFYYIEYGFAQLGALGVWTNFEKNGQVAIEQYKNALKLGYTRPIPQIYQEAGTQFEFSHSYMQSLASMLSQHLF